ncbi:MAG: alpha-amylase family protein [Lachnospiraceae bacterium]|nr:alpha-amylase family protein [Lachnospiraceae bacterium]
MKNKIDADYKKRFSEKIDELKWLYMELYNDQYAFDYFCSMLERLYTERTQTLREWDKKRTQNENWYHDNERLGMLMYVDNFAGTLNGVREHLDYINEVGVNYLHLMPLLASPEGRSDGGYAVSDFRTVDPRLGTMGDLANLSGECHNEGISICLDFVMNHTSEDHEWAVRAKNGEKEFQDRYFFFDNWDIPFRYEETVPQVFPQTAPGNFTWCDQVRKVVMTTFYPYQWDLNYRNPTVFNDMTENMLYLCNQGVDIIRLDATPYIWKTLGTNCRNLPEVHSLVRMMRIAAEIVAPGTLLLGEVVMEPKEVVPYFGSTDKPECHLLYNVTTMASTWHTVATSDVRLLRHQLGTVFALPKQYVFLNYLRCHDDIGWGLDYNFLAQFGVDEPSHKQYLNDYFRGYIYGSEARGELYNDDPRLRDARLCGTTASLSGIEAAEYEMNEDKIGQGIALDIMLHAFLFIQSGIPVLYSGDEIGMLNDYSYHDDWHRWDDSRYLHRGRLNWDEVKKRRSKNSRQGRIFSYIQKLRKLRSSDDVFHSEADTWLVETGNDCVLGIGRYYNGKKMLGFFNFSKYPQTFYTSENEEYTDMLTRKKTYVDKYDIGGYWFAWLEKKY